MACNGSLPFRGILYICSLAHIHKQLLTVPPDFLNINCSLFFKWLKHPQKTFSTEHQG